MISKATKQFKASRCKALIALGTLLIVTWCHADSSSNDIKLYRYTNNEGVKVLGHTLPPEYAQKGYEILSVKGQVLEVVPAALSQDQILRETKERELREEYFDLRRRYSSVDEIQRAKKRRLENINTNIAIIRGNIGSLNTRIDNLMSQATTIERSGKTVPQNLLRELSDSRAELAVAQSSLENRLNDYRKTADRFKHEMATFHRGSELLEKNAQLN